MSCERFRQAASAQLDGEPIGMSPRTLEHHLVTCTACAQWSAQATRLTRQARLADATAVPDLTAAITAGVVLPEARVNRRRFWLRVALVVVGLVQLAVALPALLGDSIGMSMGVHAAHEAAAWNLALVAAFVMAAVAPRRAAGLVPLLITFVAVLTVLATMDLADGHVTVARLCTHLAAVAGLALVLALDRAERVRPPRRTSAEVGAGEDQDRPGLRGVA